MVDTICSDSLKPGELRLFPAGILTPANHLINSHQMSLPTALELGRKLGYAMPLQVDVLAVGAVNVETLSEELTPSVAGAVERALSMIQEWLAGKGEEYADAEDREASVC